MYDGVLGELVKTKLIVEMKSSFSTFCLRSNVWLSLTVTFCVGSQGTDQTGEGL